MQKDIPVDEETYTILSLLSGYGLWMLLAIALIAVFLYKKFRK